MIFICDKCKREFVSKRSLSNHKRYCTGEGYIPNRLKPRNIQKYFQCECGKTFTNRDSYGAHCSHCKIHHKENNLSENRKKRNSMCWEKFSEEEIKQFYKKSGKTHSRKFKTGELIPSFTNRKHNEETKRKLREATIKYLQETVNFQGPRYSKRACEFLDILNEKFNWHLQHALNGGELNVDGYFVDGYDKNLNLVVEYDERYHYDDIERNILKERDLKRQQYIIERLHCKFYRYNSVTHQFYDAINSNIIFED